MKKIVSLTATAIVAAFASTASAQGIEDAYQAVAENCQSTNNAVMNDLESDLEQAIDCVTSIGDYFVQADQIIANHIDTMPYSFKKGVYAATRGKCTSALNLYARTGHKSDNDNPTLEERRVRATHINEVVYACLAFSHANINSDVQETTGNILLPKQHVQTIVDTAYCAADVLGESAWTTNDYDNSAACKAAGPSFN